MSNEVEIVVKARDETSGALKSAEAGTSRYGESVGAVGEKADGSERNLIGLHDVIDGTATIMQGPGKAGVAAYIQGWADLAGGIAPLLETLSKMTLATIKDTAAKIGNTVSTAANAIATKAAAVASGIWTAAQWLLNAALSANPIGIVIIAIIALVGIIILIATRTTWFQTIWKALWGFMKTVAAWFAGPFVAFFVRAFNVIVAAVRAYFRIYVTVFTAIINFVRSVPGKIVGFFSGLGARFRSVGSAIVQGIINGIQGMVGHLASVAANAAKAALNSAKSFLGIHSPSTVFREQVGKQMAAGMAQGFTAGMGDVHDAVGAGATSSAAAAQAQTSRSATAGTGQASGQDAGAVEVHFTGNTDTALATAIQKMLQAGLIRINPKYVGA